jgi:hypothetical protein
MNKMKGAQENFEEVGCVRPFRRDDLSGVSIDTNLSQFAH